MSFFMSLALLVKTLRWSFFSFLSIVTKMLVRRLFITKPSAINKARTDLRFG